ncbi:hypothetical protein [Nocardioides cavernaquae]|uniref:DUF222 domain-containing protein n=1 Tax=Nocardioides cavernaquae TaxID=2321396 RepID=A0A3A5HGT3_9ACTN|nr:hypothetical protein [Nocardioides cavernaquae]RJS46887.1 hypothetical protein D4739_12120 [Nocardioides cavernaquae]
MANSGTRFSELSRRDLLDSASAREQARRRADIDLLLIAREWAIANGPDVVHLTRAGKPGRVRLREYGATGTPLVASTAGAQLAARMGRSTGTGDRWIADVVDIEHRLPSIWTRTLAGAVMPSYARHVATQTRALSVEAAAYVDARVAESVDGRIPWGRFEALVAAAVTAADPAAASAREEANRKARYAHKHLSNEAGMGIFTIRTDAFGIAKIDATVDYLARILKDLGSTDGEDDRRATAAELLADPAAVVKLLAAYAGWRDRPTDDADDALALASDRGGRDQDDRTVLGDADADPAGESRGIVDAAIKLWDQTHNRPDDGPTDNPSDGSGDGPTGGACDGSSGGGKPVIDWSRLLPTLTIFVHLYGGRITQTPDRTGSGRADGSTGGRTVVGADRDGSPDLVRIEGIGVVTEAWLRGHFSLHPHQKVRLTPVLDIEGQAPVDAWEIPDRHRQAVRLMTPADSFPWGSSSTNRSDGWRSMQIDHNTPWTPDVPGLSTIGNYGPLTQFHHNLKTHCGWEVQQPFPGIYLWRDPHGAYYLVDHTGTRALGNTG